MEINEDLYGKYIKTEKYELYNYDNIEIMDLLIAQGVQVDLTVTSPPYDDLRSYDGTLNWNFEIFKKVAQRLYDITKEGGVVVWVVGDKTKNGSESGTSFKQALYFKEIGFNLHDTMIYAKTNYVPLTHKRYEQGFEYMFILTKGKIKTFNGIREESKYAGTKPRPTHRNKSKDNDIPVISNSVSKNRRVNDTKLKSNIWFYTVGKNHTTMDEIAFKHPAIFPEKLAEDHILSWSNEGDLVLDCFMGSNTTGKMALKNNRKYIGIEIVEEYFKIANQRIKDYSTDNE